MICNPAASSNRKAESQFFVNIHLFLLLVIRSHTWCAYSHQWQKKWTLRSAYHIISPHEIMCAMAKRDESLKGWVIATDSIVAMGRCKGKKGVEEWVKIEVKFVWQACNVISIQNLNRAACVEIRGGKLSPYDENLKMRTNNGKKPHIQSCITWFFKKNKKWVLFC